MGDAAHLDEDSYLLGLEIGLQTALCCRDRLQIQESLARVKQRMIHRELLQQKGSADD
jgi:hypothetical protein